MTPTRACPLLVLFAVAACTAGPDYVRPELPGLTAWHADDAAFPPTAVHQAWWHDLGSAQLDQLVAAGLADSFDLRSAVARIRAARAAAGLSEANRWPQIDGAAGYTRTRTTEATPSPVRGRNYDTWSLGLDVSWEIDLFGRLAREHEANVAEVAGSEADAAAVRIALAADIVAAYADLVGAGARRAIAQSSVTAAEQLVALTGARARGGVGNDLDTARAERLLAAARARIPAQERAWRDAGNRLAVLVGRVPGDLPVDLAAATSLGQVPDVVAIGLPAELVQQRPDVAAAEHRLHAATARLGAALADRFPRLSLSGFFGLEADRGQDLLRNGSRAMRAGPAVNVPLFTGGGVGARIATREAEIDAVTAELQQTVLRAFAEVESATGALQSERQRVAELTAAVAAAERACTFAQQRFDAGLDDFLAVIDAEQSRLDLRDQLATATTEVVRQFATLHKALGSS